MSLIISNVMRQDRQQFRQQAWQEVMSHRPGDCNVTTMEFIDFKDPTQRGIVNRIAKAVEDGELVVADKSELPNTLRIVEEIVRGDLNGTAQQELDRNLIALNVPADEEIKEQPKPELTVDQSAPAGYYLG